MRVLIAEDEIGYDIVVAAVIIARVRGDNIIAVVGSFTQAVKIPRAYDIAFMSVHVRLLKYHSGYYNE